MNKYLFPLIVLFLLTLQTKSQTQQLSKESIVSILTCDPGKEVYSMYGHSAIRIKDPELNLDVVFNYGVFSFEGPHFLYRFAKGLTDYRIDAGRFVGFIPEYEEEKRSVYEQVLDLSQEGKTKLFQALIENNRPENRVYRYNFFTDNCATRVRDMIERNSAASIHFPGQKSNESYRKLIKKYHGPFRWFDLGIDLLVGKKADEPIAAYKQMFLPEYLYNQLSTAQITESGKSRPLVLRTNTLLEYPSNNLNTNFPLPLFIFGAFFLFITGISIRDIFRKKKTDWIDYVLLSISGLSGFIIGWFTLYSEHPAVSPNYNLLWAFPLNLLFAVIWKVKKWRKKTHTYFYLTTILLLFSFFMGQQFNPAVYLIILTLLVRNTVNLIPGIK